MNTHSGDRPLHLAVVMGTRPEAVKLAPLVLAAAAQPDRFKVDVVSTGQHKEMLASMLDWFGLKPSVSLDIMRANQDLAHITMSSLSGINDWLKVSKPDWVIVQGDTTSALAGAIAARPESTVVLTTGDGGGLMAIADLESAVRSARGHGIAVVWNDAAYGAEAS